MSRTKNDIDVEAGKEEQDYIFFLNEENAPRGCVGYWCEWCHFSSAFRRYSQVDHIIPVAAAVKYGVGPDYLKSVDNACVLCVACNASKNKYGFPREGVGLAYRMPNQNMTWGVRRRDALEWDELIEMCKRKGRFRRQE